MQDRPLIYVCSPYGGSEENYRRALTYGSYVFSKGGIPVIPHTMYHGILNDKSRIDRESGLYAGKRLLKLCDRVWVFGREGFESAGMKGEISAAAEFGIPVEYIDGSKPLQPDEKATVLSVILRHYESTYGNIGRIMVDDIQYFLSLGITDKLIIRCIDIAARHNARWAYAKAILVRCARDKIFTLEEFEAQAGKAVKSDSDYGAYDLAAFEQILNSN